MAACTPHQIDSGCACALICARCGRCFAHCTCIPEGHRPQDTGRLLAALRHLVNTRRVPFTRSSR
jgi:hypothetical protein